MKCSILTVILRQTSARIGTDGDSLDEDEISFSERLSLKGLLLLRACSKMIFHPAVSFRYQTEDDKREKLESKEAIR